MDDFGGESDIVILDWEISDEDIRILVFEKVDEGLDYFTHLE